jgi:predicted lactoylglutathione lyase
MEFDSFIAWATGPNAPGIGLTKPFDGNAATVGNGVMVAIACDSPAKVDQVYKKAMELGAKDEGRPARAATTSTPATFRDPDGNKLNAFCMTKG